LLVVELAFSHIKRFKIVVFLKSSTSSLMRQIYRNFHKITTSAFIEILRISHPDFEFTTWKAVIKLASKSI